MHINALYNALVSRGVRISGKNPKANLSAKLSPPSDIVFVRNEGWYCRTDENGGSVGPSEAKAEDAGGTFGFLNPNPASKGA